MPPRKPLRAVAPDETAAPSAPKSVTQAADSGTTRDLLVAMRTRVAKAVEDANTPPRDLAALSKRLVEIVRDIEAIDAREDQGGGRAGSPVIDEAWSAI